jgi:hypothetical protein
MVSNGQFILQLFTKWFIVVYGVESVMNKRFELTMSANLSRSVQVKLQNYIVTGLLLNRNSELLFYFLYVLLLSSKINLRIMLASLCFLGSALCYCLKLYNDLYGRYSDGMLHQEFAACYIEAYIEVLYLE